MDFYTGNVLRIDLSAGTSKVEPLNMEWAERYIGGKGLLIRYLWDEVEPGIDPLAPENPMLFVTGPLAGTNVSTASRLVIGAKSPVTGMLNDSYVGGSFAPEMKFAGYDMIIVTGRAPEPTVVCIKDDVVELRPAAKYWGMKTSEIEAALRADFDAGAKVASIGPAGENGVPWACVSTDQYHKAGRGGHGWLMGSKNLKAIAVRGTGTVLGGRRQGLPRRHASHARRLRADRRQPVGQRGGHARPRPAHERRRLHPHAQLDGRLVRGDGEHQLGRLAEDQDAQPGLLPVRYRLSPVARGRRRQGRGARSTRRSPSAARTAAWAISPPS